MVFLFMQRKKVIDIHYLQKVKVKVFSSLIFLHHSKGRLNLGYSYIVIQYRPVKKLMGGEVYIFYQVRIAHLQEIFAANLWSRVIGGYLNIASKHGLTINIGTEGISRDEDVTRTLREKVNAYDLATEKVWKVLSGQKGSMSFNQMEARQAIDDKF